MPGTTVQDRKSITIKDNKGNILQAKNNMKVLGSTLNARASMDTHLSRIKSRIGMELAKIKLYLTFMTSSDQKLIVNAKLKSILDYSLPYTWVRMMLN